MNKDNVIYCSHGSEYEPVFEIGIDENGAQCLKPVMVGDKQKMHNIQEEIQSYKDETDIKSIVARALNGDLSVLGDEAYISDDPVFDTTLYNKSVNELHQINLQAEATLKASYNNFAGKDQISYVDYAKAIQSGDIETLTKLTAGGDTNGNDSE